MHATLTYLGLVYNREINMNECFEMYCYYERPWEASLRKHDTHMMSLPTITSMTHLLFSCLNHFMLCSPMLVEHLYAISLWKTFIKNDEKRQDAYVTKKKRRKIYTIDKTRVSPTILLSSCPSYLALRKSERMTCKYRNAT